MNMTEAVTPSSVDCATREGHKLAASCHARSHVVRAVNPVRGVDCPRGVFVAAARPGWRAAASAVHCSRYGSSSDRFFTSGVWSRAVSSGVSGGLFTSGGGGGSERLTRTNLAPCRHRLRGRGMRCGQHQDAFTRGRVPTSRGHLTSRSSGRFRVTRPLLCCSAPHLLERWRARGAPRGPAAERGRWTYLDQGSRILQGS